MNSIVILLVCAITDYFFVIPGCDRGSIRCYVIPGYDRGSMAFWFTPLQRAISQPAKAQGEQV